MITESNREYLIKFGENLRKIRIEKDLSLRKLALNCNIDSAQINKIEQGQVNATILTVVELAKGLDIEPTDLLRI